jgi:hypothetical protein
MCSNMCSGRPPASVILSAPNVRAHVHRAENDHINDWYPDPEIPRVRGSVAQLTRTSLLASNATPRVVANLGNLAFRPVALRRRRQFVALTPRTIGEAIGRVVVQEDLLRRIPLQAPADPTGDVGQMADADRPVANFDVGRWLPREVIGQADSRDNTGLAVWSPCIERHAADEHRPSRRINRAT